MTRKRTLHSTPVSRLAVIQDQASSLIRAEVLAASNRAKLEAAIHQAITKVGCTVDEVSAASGLAPSEIRRIVKNAPKLSDADELEALAGSAV